MTLVLASRSPRRRQLLEQIGVRFETVSVDIDEAPLPDESATACAERLARRKAEAGRALRRDQPILAADTVVAFGHRLFGKPRDEADAVDMLTALSANEHQVVTAVALANNGQTHCLASVSRVRFRTISTAEARAYWASGEPMDKAGAYAIQGLGAIFISHLNGSYTGVMGLPLYETATLLAGAGFPLLCID